MGIKRVPHPPYSPDRALCDFCLFPKLWGCHYDTIEEMKEAVTKVIDTLTQEDFDGALQKFLEWYKCIATGGDYFEGDLSFMGVLWIKVPIRKKSGNLSSYQFSYFGSNKNASIFQSGVAFPCAKCYSQPLSDIAFTKLIIKYRQKTTFFEFTDNCKCNALYKILNL